MPVCMLCKGPKPVRGFTSTSTVEGWCHPHSTLEPLAPNTFVFKIKPALWSGLFVFPLPATPLFTRCGGKLGCFCRLSRTRCVLNIFRILVPLGFLPSCESEPKYLPRPAVSSV